MAWTPTYVTGEGQIAIFGPFLGHGWQALQALQDPVPGVGPFQLAQDPFNLPPDTDAGGNVQFLNRTGLFRASQARPRGGGGGGDGPAHDPEQVVSGHTDTAQIWRLFLVSGGKA